MPPEINRSAAAGRWLGGALLLFATALPLSIAVAQIALTVAVIAWLCAGRPGPGRRAPLLLPAAAFAAWTLLSAAASPVPLESLADSRKLALFVVLVLVPGALAAAPAWAARLPLAFVSGAALAAGRGVIAYLRTEGGLAHRSQGPFGMHYMTFGGLLMLATVVVVARLLYGAGAGARERTALLAVLALFLAGLGVSFARSAWLGLLAGTLAVALALRPRVVPLVIAVAAIAVVVAPRAMRERAATSFQVEQNLDRVEMVRVGFRMIADHPVLGVGPHRVEASFADYPGTQAKVHLHNNAVQIAAERGLPALAAWLWLLSAAAVGALRRQRTADSAAGLGAIAGLLVAGLFEYNFGDSEVNMAFLLLLSLALAAPKAETQ